MLEEYKEMLVDRFEAWELVDLFDLTVEDLLDAFEDRLWHKRAVINELLGIDDDE